MTLMQSATPLPRIALYKEGEETYAWFWCGGCETNHRVPVTGSRAWTWNGELERVTFAPSIKVTWHKTRNGGTERVTDDHGNDIMHVCHSFVRDGRIEYLGDSTHHLAGQMIDLESAR